MLPVFEVLRSMPLIVSSLRQRSIPRKSQQTSCPGAWSENIDEKRLTEKNTCAAVYGKDAEVQSMYL
jgi:hypothetical protein